MYVTITASSHPGIARPDNQDCVGFGSWRSAAAMWRPVQRRMRLDRPLLCVVADGIGGRAGGAVASDVAVRALLDRVDKIVRPEDVIFVLRETDHAICEHMRGDPALEGMGTTVAGLLIREDRQIWFNVGDSRIYQYRDPFLRQVSVDHVLHADRPGARSHVIVQSLGGATSPSRLDPHVEAGEPALVPSRWLICSDGLSDMLSREDMEKAMQGDDLGAWLNLFAGAMEAGAMDNISIMLVSIEPDEEGRGDHG
ncbi:MAG: protein phosphatase 2C domain-containing protein [Pseudomonadota bacterium]